jgi:NADPH:quinone reductase-like Zn-dependent oxidoreductase
MKAFVQDRYGPPEVLHLEEVDRPVPGEKQVLIRVRAASVNALDWHLMAAKPWLARMGRGWSKPRDRIRGVDVAGTVESVGPGVTQWKPGDAVFGTAHGTFAEYATSSDASIANKPEPLSFEQAAAVPIAAFTALEGLRDHAAVKPGQHVLINGSGGGVGTFAIQIAKWLGAHVSAATSPANLDTARSLGADEVIDYTREDVTRSGRTFDAVFDLGSTRSLTANRRVIKPGGIYLMVGALPKTGTVGFLGRMIKMKVASKFVPQRLGAFMAKAADSDLLVLRQLAQEGRLKPVIGRVYPFEQLPDAMRVLMSGQTRGKLVVSLMAS